MKRPFRHGKPGLGWTPGERRAWWVTSLDRAAELAGLVAEGATLSDAQAWDLSGVAAQAIAVRFPLEFKSAACAADGFRQLVRGCVDASAPELKRALARAAAEAARCCRRLIDIDTEQQAAAVRRRYGED